MFNSLQYKNMIPILGSLLATFSYLAFLPVPLYSIYKDGVGLENVCNTIGYALGIAAYIAYTITEHKYYKSLRKESFAQNEFLTIH